MVSLQSPIESNLQDGARWYPKHARTHTQTNTKQLARWCKMEAETKKKKKKQKTIKPTPTKTRAARLLPLGFPAKRLGLNRKRREKNALGLSEGSLSRRRQRVESSGRFHQLHATVTTRRRSEPPLHGFPFIWPWAFKPKKWLAPSEHHPPLK